MADITFRYEVQRGCTTCLMCYYECPTGAISIVPDVSAVIDQEKCIRCGRCVRNCHAEAIVKIPTKSTAQK